MVLLSVLATLPVASFALNPVIQTMYTADPAPMVHKGTLYLFSSHDEDVGEANNFNMKNWVLATTTDMVNWTRAFTASLSSAAKPKQATAAKIEIRLGKLDGQLIGTLAVSGTGGAWQPQSTRIAAASGVHDLFFVFRGAAGEELFKFDFWQFSQRGLPADKAAN